MKNNKLSILLSITLLVVIMLSAAAPVTAQEVDKSIRIWVTYKAGTSQTVLNTLNPEDIQLHYHFPELESYVITISSSKVDSIMKDPNVISIEEDPLRYPLQITPTDQVSETLFHTNEKGQTVPYGIDMVQALDVWDHNRDGIIDTGANTGEGITVCIIDSGYYQDHEDLPNAIGGESQVDDNWARDGYGHGSHVGGTIAAENNEYGVVGVTPGTVSLYIVKFFNDNGDATYASSLVNALTSCSNAGANIVSMSLGGSRYNRSEERAFNTAYAAGVLSIAAAGNEGTSDFSYPASYDSVVSVAAIDESMTVADFSQFNSQVELAAPGVGVLSTIPYLETNTLEVNGISYQANHIEFSAYGTASAQLVHGGLCGSTDSSWSGKVVLCERGTYDFSVKVLSVQNSGGLAAVIYNNAPGNFLGTMGEGNSSTIIGLSISQEDGQFLVANALGSTAIVTSTLEKPASGYEAWDGTSMATPHVSGVAALVWSCMPTATNAEVRSALTSTAFDLGTAGRDVYYGYGLVRAWDACLELNPTSVDLLSFTAAGTNKTIELSWETANEIDNLGFNLYRASTETGEKLKLNEELIPTLVPPGSLFGASYTFTDSFKLSRLATYYYWLEDVDNYGRTTLHGPVSAQLTNKILPVAPQLFFQVRP